MKGKRCYGVKELRHKTRVSKIAALRGKTLFAPLAFTGYCNKDVFKTYTQKILIPELEQGDVVVMDNISFHKSDDVIALFKKKELM